MAKFLTIVFLLAFMVAVPIAMAAEKPAAGPKVACCHKKGECDNLHTKAECEKEGGKVVKSCKDCK